MCYQQCITRRRRRRHYDATSDGSGPVWCLFCSAESPPAAATVSSSIILCTCQSERWSQCNIGPLVGASNDDDDVQDGDFLSGIQRR